MIPTALMRQSQEPEGLRKHIPTYIRSRLRCVHSQLLMHINVRVHVHSAVTGLYSDTDYIATHVLATVAIQSVSLYCPGNGPYSDTFFSDFLCKNKPLYLITFEDSSPLHSPLPSYRRLCSIYSTNHPLRL